jgi:hypothetical protein
MSNVGSSVTVSPGSATIFHTLPTSSALTSINGQLLAMVQSAFKVVGGSFIR